MNYITSVSLAALILFICKVSVLVEDFFFETSLPGGVTIICSYFHVQVSEKQ